MKAEVIEQKKKLKAQKKAELISRTAPNQN